MSKKKPEPVIRLRGVRHNNLKNFDLDLPMRRLIVITGLSGSGKSTLAFDTLFAEGQRRYIETFSPYARQFFDRMDKPQVESIEGIPPAIAIEQRNTVKTTRSTVGTMTEICDYMKVLWPHIARLHCRQCGEPVQKDSPQRIWEHLNTVTGTRNAELLVTFDVQLSEKLSLEESLDLVAKQGYQRLFLDGEIIRVDEAVSHFTLNGPRAALTVVQDRLKFSPENRARFVEACEHAYHFGQGELTIHFPTNPQLFSSRLHCARCDIEYSEPSPALFSFNHPLGACPACKGFGRIITIDYDLAIPDRSKTLKQGAVKPWQSGVSADCQSDLMKFCRASSIPTDVPFEDLPQEQRDWVINGDPDYGTDEEHEWPRAWYGVKGYFRWLESKAYKMHVRVLLSRYRAYTTCPECRGRRLKPEALLYQLDWPSSLPLPNEDGRFPSPAGPGGGGTSARAPSEERGMETEKVCEGEQATRLSLPGFYQLPIRDALAFINQLASNHKSKPSDPLGLALNEVLSRLGFLDEVGLGYLTLDRPTRSLSGGETERVNLTTCLGTGLVNTLFILDEPSVGLHPRDTERLVHILERLRDTGNTVVVVEHEAGVIRAADQIIDLGPGHGAAGGEVVFQGPMNQLLGSPTSLTGQYLSGRRQINVPIRRPVHLNCPPSASSPEEQQPDRLSALALNDAILPYGAESDNHPTLVLSGASRHNLQNLSVEIPLMRFVVITGVSGSGKTTLMREVLLPALERQLKSPNLDAGPAGDRIDQEENEDNDDNNVAAVTSHPSQLSGWKSLSRVVLVDQSPIGKTPRSNPAVYIGAFDDIRELFAQSETARQRGLKSSAFSFNSPQGQCERCRGAGFEKIEMQFLSDVFIRCPDCNGRRYRSHILEVKLGPRSKVQGPKNPRARASQSAIHNSQSTIEWSIANVLEATVDEVIHFLSGFDDSKPARRACGSLALLQEVGLGYLRLGQPINTLSGGESQRLKLVRHLADSQTCFRHPAGTSNQSSHQHAGSTLFLFDEPTTGLHFDDVRVLLEVFQRLVDVGHSIIVVEHNMDVIKCADWIIDLGPDAGDQGGRLVAAGTPENIANCDASHTGRFLKTIFKSASRQPEHRATNPAISKRSNSRLSRRITTRQLSIPRSRKT